MKRTTLNSIVATASKPQVAGVAAATNAVLAEKPVKDFAPNHSPKRAPCRQGMKSNQFFLPPEIHAELKILCIREGVSFEGYIKNLINKDFEMRNMDIRIPTE